MNDNIKHWCRDIVAAAQMRRDWQALPSDFERDAVRNVFKVIRPHFDKSAISMRIAASKAVTFEQLKAILQ